MKISRTNQISFAFIFCLLSAVLSSCVSVNPYERLDSDQCLILIPVEIDNNTGQKLGSEYELRDSSKNFPKVALTTAFGEFVPIVVSKKVYYDQIVGHSVQDSNQLNGQVNRFTESLPFEPGKVVVANFVFKLSQVIIDFGEYYQKEYNFGYKYTVYRDWYELKKASPLAKQKALDQAKSNPKLKEWFEDT